MSTTSLINLDAIKGNYFFGTYSLPQTTGRDSVETIIVRNSPGDLTHHLWTCPVDYRHVEMAAESAFRSFDTWKKTSVVERKSIIDKFKNNLLGNSEKLALTTSLETGRPLWDTKHEILQVVKATEAALCRIDRFFECSPAHFNTINTPIGSTLIIGPSAEPNLVMATQAISALLAGNTIVVKPSPLTCLSGQILFDALVDSGFPSGVINLVQGDTEISRRLIKEKHLKTIFFTGSKQDGLDVLNVTHQNLSKKVSLSLGAKNVCILHEDINPHDHINEIVRASYMSNGQARRATSIVAIHKKHTDKFIEAFHDAAKNIEVAHPLHTSNNMFLGALIDQASVDSYLLFIGMAKREGIEEIMRGKALERAPKGLYVTPSIHFAKKFNSKSLFLASELNAPNCTFIEYSDIEEAISIVNNNDFGLLTSLYTKDSNTLNKCTQNIDTGTIYVNRPTIDYDYNIPMIGLKASGNFFQEGSGVLHTSTFKKTISIN